MLKNLLFIIFILSTSATFSAESSYGDFEAELRALETNQLKSEELQMNQADAVTDVISDEVGTGQAGVLRNADLSEITTKSSEASSAKKDETSIRTRRVRSR